VAGEAGTPVGALSPLPPTRGMYGPADLTPLIRPRSVAVVGASATGTGFGSAALRELAGSGFEGALYAVNPKLERGAELLSARCLPSLEDLPEPVDCLLVALPAHHVVPVVETGAGLGCRSAIIFSAGFGEAAGGDTEAEAALGRIAASTGIRIGGPNTAGILNYRDRLPLTFVSDLRMDLPSGNLAIVSQSAGIATHLGHVRHRGARLSYTITTGNSVDVNAFDYVNFLLNDEATDVIVLALEGVSNPAALRVLGEESHRERKPILVLKGGRTTQGSRAAVSHTGSLAGSYDVFCTAVAEAGLTLCTSTEELVETALLFAKWARKCYRPGGVAVLTTMGGPGVLAADASDDHGIELPSPSPDTSERLRSLMPSFAAVGNPIDTTAFQSDAVLADALTVLASDDSFSAVVALVATTTGAATEGRPAAVAGAARDTKTPMAAVWLSSWLEGPGSEVLDASLDLAIFRSTDRCFRAIALWQQWHARLPADHETRDDVQAAIPAGVSTGIAKVLDATPNATGTLDEWSSIRILEAAGIGFPALRLARTAEEAVASANEIGSPVVAKVVSPDIPHKARVGGVVTGLHDPEAVRAAFNGIMSAVRAERPDARIEGILIAEAVPARYELMCGMVRDPTFGPVVVCGAGGSDVEEEADVVRCLAPVTRDHALHAIRRLRLYRKILRTDPDTARRAEAGLVRVMATLGQLGLAEPRIREVDLNPVVVHDSEVVALDALVVLH
jgi:acyl-CoA synthetase (NDP forming)